MAGLKFAFFAGVFLLHLIATSTGSGVANPPADKKLYLLCFNWNNGTQWQEELADAKSHAFIQTAEELKQKLDWLFDENPNVLYWDVIALAKNSASLKVSAHVRTPSNVSAEELARRLSRLVQTQIKSERKMVSDFVAEELNSKTPSLAILPHSTIIQMSPFKTAMTSTQAMSPVSATPEMPNDKITKLIIPADAVNFVVSMKVENIDYIPTMADAKSTDFKKLAAEIEAVLYKELCVRKLPGCLGITVIKLERGSVIVTYNIHTTSSTKYGQSDVQTIISDSAKNDNLGHLQVSNVEVNKEVKREEKNSELKGAPSGIFIYLLYGAGTVLVIALTILAVFKYKSCKNQIQAGRH